MSTTATQRSVQRAFFIAKRSRCNVIIPKRRYATTRINKASMGIFEPFLNDNISDKKPIDKQVLLKDMLSKATIKDILPEDEILNLAIKTNQTTLSIDTQKEIVSLLLKDTIDKEKILKLVNDTPTELTAFGNILLRSSKLGAPLALELYKLGMEHGDDRGAFSYANMIYRGYGGTAKNEEEGIKVMSQLAQKGHPYAQFNLAAIIMRTQPDQMEAAIQLYQLAGKSGLDKAYTELGRMYRLGYGVHQDHKKAIEYFKKGAETGNPQCNFMLGVYWSSGLGNEERKPDQEKAFKHFQKAAVKGLIEAQYNVGLRYLKGYGVEINSFNAAEFFRMAAVQGFQLAQVNLAGMYSEGRGVQKDLDQARDWLQKAVEGGGAIGKDAQKRLDELDQIQGKQNNKCNIM